MWKIIKKIFSKKTIDEYDVIIYLMSLKETEYLNILRRSHLARNIQ